MTHTQTEDRKKVRASYDPCSEDRWAICPGCGNRIAFSGFEQIDINCPDCSKPLQVTVENP